MDADDKRTQPTLYIHLSPGQNAGPDRALFGYQIPYLPDSLADHTLLGQSDYERVSEILSRWTQLIVGLHKWRGSAFALRFLADPQRGAIDVALVGRLSAEREQVERRARAVAADLGAQLTSLGIPFRPLPEEGLRRALYPFEGAWSIVEVRQHEELTPFLAVNQDAYVVHPFWAPAGSWLLPFEAMLRQPDRVTVSVYLEPTGLLNHEREALVQASRISQTVADLHRATLDVRSIDRWRDPQAERVGRVYTTLLPWLSEPFLMVVQAASPDPSVAWTVGRSVGAAVIAGRDRLAIEAAEQELPSGFDTRAPQSAEDLAAARRCFAHLAFSPWGNGLATEEKARLVYLVGAKGAAAAFRLPISVRGGVPGIAVQQPAPDFEPGPRPLAAASDELHLGTFRRGGAATVACRQLTRHTLVTGFTGSGKTNTVLYLLDQLWSRHRIPFLVIEAAKKEYRGLLGQPGFEDLLVFTLGDETTSPFRLNPFELLPGVRLEAHLAQLQTCFDAALPQFGILPSIIAESLELIYRDKRWQLTDKGGASTEHLFPTMRDLLAKVVAVAKSRGYAGEVYQNIQAAAAGRIGSLLRGSKGRMFSCQRSIPVDLIMARPVVLELNDLNQQDKALTMMFLLVLLREYREQHKAKTLQHVTVVEEAHNVMENVRSVGASEVAADTRAKAVEAFSAMLAEVRAYGEGIIISDQSPEKLAPDAVRNTNLQIAHQLRHRDDREAISAAMIMDEAQKAYLGKLKVGEAAVFLTGYDRATFVGVPNYKDDVGFQEPSDAEIHAHMTTLMEPHARTFLPRDGCRFCGQPCHYQATIEPQTLDRELGQQLRVALKRFDEHPEPAYWAENWRLVVTVCARVAAQAGHPGELDAGWCYLVHGIDFRFTEHMRQWYERVNERMGG